MTGARDASPGNRTRLTGPAKTRSCYPKIAASFVSASEPSANPYEYRGTAHGASNEPPAAARARRCRHGFGPGFPSDAVGRLCPILRTSGRCRIALSADFGPDRPNHLARQAVATSRNNQRVAAPLCLDRQRALPRNEPGPFGQLLQSRQRNSGRNLPGRNRLGIHNDFFAEHLLARPIRRCGRRTEFLAPLRHSPMRRPGIAPRSGARNGRCGQPSGQQPQQKRIRFHSFIRLKSRGLILRRRSSTSRVSRSTLASSVCWATCHWAFSCRSMTFSCKT